MENALLRRSRKVPSQKREVSLLLDAHRFDDALKIDKRLT